MYICLYIFDFCDLQCSTKIFISPFISCFNSFVSSIYFSVNNNADVTLNATQVVTVYFAVVETASSSLCTEKIVLIDVTMLC